MLIHRWEIIFVGCLCFSLVGCESIWNAGNRGSLKKDIGQLLTKAKVSNVELNCHMVGATRTGICESKIPSAALTDIASVLKLSEVKSNDPEDHEFTSWSQKGACVSQQQGPTFKRFKSQRRAPELRLKNGGAFEYFILFHNSATDETCIQVSYAYG